MKDNLSELENGIFMDEGTVVPDGPITSFRLIYKGITLTPLCYRLGYIKGVLIAVACNKIIVYKPEIKIVNDVPTLVKVADFSSYESGAYLKVTIGGKSYIIDNHVQISICNCIKPY